MIIRSTIAAALIATAFAAAPGSAEASGYHVGQSAKVVGVAPYSVLNVRAGPGVYNAKVGQIPAHARGVAVHSCVPRKGSSDWCKVTWKNCTGWVSARFLAWW